MIDANAASPAANASSCSAVLPRDVLPIPLIRRAFSHYPRHKANVCCSQVLPILMGHTPSKGVTDNTHGTHTRSDGTHTEQHPKWDTHRHIPNWDIPKWDTHRTATRPQDHSEMGPHRTATRPQDSIHSTVKLRVTGESTSPALAASLLQHQKPQRLSRRALVKFL